MIAGRSVSRHLTTRGVGMVSRELDFLLDFEIICLTSSSLNVLNKSNLALGESVVHLWGLHR